MQSPGAHPLVTSVRHRQGSQGPKKIFATIDWEGDRPGWDVLRFCDRAKARSCVQYIRTPILSPFPEGFHCLPSLPPHSFSSQTNWRNAPASAS